MGFDTNLRKVFIGLFGEDWLRMQKGVKELSGSSNLILERLFCINKVGKKLILRPGRNKFYLYLNRNIIKTPKPTFHSYIVPEKLPLGFPNMYVLFALLRLDEPIVPKSVMLKFISALPVRVLTEIVSMVCDKPYVRIIHLKLNY